MITWILLRAAGIGAYLMLWATVTWGLAGTTSLFGKRVAKQTSIAVHQFLSTVALALLGMHIGLLLIDAFMPFHPLDVLIPLHGSFRPGPVAFGILAMYSMVVVLASSWLRKRVGPKWWRRFHLLTIPAFALALVHGVFTGTDTARAWMWWGYLGTGAVVLFLTLVRAFTAGFRPERAAPPAHARRTGADAARAGRPARPAPVRSGGPAPGHHLPGRAPQRAEA